MAEGQSGTDVREIAGMIVASYLENNQMPPEQVPNLIASVINALRTSGGEAAETAEPAVPIKKSVGTNVVTCLVCGKRLKTLRRHIRTAHSMSEQEYREAFNLPRDHPLVSRNYSKERAEMAKRIGLGQKRKTGGRRKKKA